MKKIIDNLINRIAIYTGKKQEDVKKYLDDNVVDAFNNFIINRKIDLNSDIVLKTSKYIQSPYDLKNAEKAANIIKKYCDNNKNCIYIFGDYDCDGLCAGYVMSQSIKKVSKCSVITKYPERTEGYGLNKDFCDYILNNTKHYENTLVITVDNGITMLDEIKYLQENNIEVIVTDHHNSLNDIPECLIVNPHNAFEKNNEYGKNLCGCAIAFKICQILHELYGIYDMLYFTPYVATATLSDVMTLDCENIAMIQYGLDMLNSSQSPVSFKALKTISDIDVFTSENLLWDIIPRINACGRMNDVEIGAELFNENNIDNAILIAENIDKLNKNRKELTKKAEESMKKNVNINNIVFFSDDNCKEGINGIIAGRAVEYFNVPSIVYNVDNENVCRGSARSCGDIDLKHHFTKLLDLQLIRKFGGHSKAAGIEFDLDKIDNIIEYFNKNVEIEKINKKDKISKTFIIDGSIEYKNLNLITYSLFNIIPSNGKEIEYPILAIKNIKLDDISYSKNNPNNIQFKFDKYKKIWAWGLAEKYKELGSPDKINLVGKISKNFMYKGSYTLNVLDVEAAD